MTKLPPGALGICQTSGGSGNSHSASRHISAALTRIACAMFRPLQQLALCSLTLPLLLACASAEPAAPQSQSKTQAPQLKAVEAPFQNIIDPSAFAELPELTNWTIAFLDDFTLTRDFVTRSGYREPYELSLHMVRALKNEESTILVLSDIPSCEGAGGHIMKTPVHSTRQLEDGSIEHLTKFVTTGVGINVLQGACSEYGLLPDGTEQIVAGTYADMIMFNLIPNLGTGHKWELKGDRLILLDAAGNRRAEFLRSDAPYTNRPHQDRLRAKGITP